ncbi:RNA polymerase sigma factor [Roseibacillus persicicus]|uniref:DNA-directed RNA polymerase sigma-70 factor n=1 Tax=Roseibacillus persicicus TaxID=454148 RepID=A0A918TMH7_9BACT|nr:sigma-70 family RNA polymerase sigma factor [Roseibacillus persicicus]GHC55746.1 DNA-directed RNA polymerase sigma-70 factor [Roseibacillus persicicus]
MPDDESNNVIAAKAQDVGALTLDWQGWLRVNGPRLLLFARQQTRNGQDAEDALQDALVKLAKKVDEGTFVGGQEAWMPFLYTQIRREAIDRGRKDDRRRKREEHVVEDAKGLETTESGNWFLDSNADGEQAELVEQALKELPPKFSEVIVMKIWGDRTFDDIGKALGISLHTAASRYRYGLDALRKKLAAARIRGDI